MTLMSAISIFPVGVVGAGTMGTGLAQLAAASNHTVYLFDSNHDTLEKSLHTIERSMHNLLEKGKVSAEFAKGVIERIHPVTDLKHLDKARIVIEAIVEDVTAKQNIFRDIEKEVSDSCILASNTSSLSIASIGSGLKKADRFLGLHFFNPATVMPLVEIVPGIGTLDGTISVARNLVESWGKVCVVTRDTPGFIVNRVARPFYGESVRIFEEGIADAATIDWALKEHGGFRMGPFELMDFIGIDINYTVTKSVFESFFFDPRYKPSITQQRLFEAKRFGRKSGIGFYEYGEGATVMQPNKDPVAGQAIFERVLTMLINEAADALFWKVASRDDIELAIVKGVNYPQGLLQWADSFGIKKTVQILSDLQELYGEDRYRVSPLLKRMAGAGQRFYE